MNKIYGSLILSAVLYGSISTIAKPSLSMINPVLLTSLIYLIIGVSLTIIIEFGNYRINSDYYPLRIIFLTSISGAVIAPILYFTGLKLTDASVVSILINAEFLFTILFAISILKENPTKTGYLGIVCILSGLLVINLSENSFNQDFFQNSNFIGNMFIIGSTIFWALDNNISKIILQKETPIIKLIQLKSLIGGTLSMIIVIILNISFSINIAHIPSLLFLSLGGFAGSLFLFLMGMKKVGTIESVMIFSTSTLFGIVFATVFLD